MPGKDHRTRVTKMLIRRAFTDLLRVKPVQSISIKELCEKAGVNRGTFYAHYASVHDLLMQMEDEIASMGCALGASLTGVKSMTATSGPGFSLKQELIGFGAMAEIPVVIVSIMRMGPSTGLPTSPAAGDIMQAKWGTHGDHPAICICPTSVKEMHDLTVAAFNYAEKYRTPVMLMTDEVIAHMREGVVFEDHYEVIDRVHPAPYEEGYLPYACEEGSLVPPMAAYGEGYRFHVTGLSHDESGFPTNSPAVNDRLIRRLCAKVEADADNIVIYDGAIASLQRFKVSVKEVAQGYECGITFEKFQDIKEGDIVEAYLMEQIQV